MGFRIPYLSTVDAQTTPDMQPNRNLLHNGAMQVAQRGTSTAGISAGGYYTADRWALTFTSAAVFTQSVENDAPTGSGFRKSVKMLTTTASASPSAGHFVGLSQSLEGQDVQRIAKGTSSAQQLTLSFWVKSNTTGTYVAELTDNDNTRSVSAAYTISASATWERKTITFPADTTGAFDNDNASSLTVNFWLLLGSTFTSGSLQTAWGTRTNANIGPGQTNLAATINNYWQVTGVQLEVGPVATPFEFKSYGQELRECQRYYWRSNADALFGSAGYGFAYSTTKAVITVNTPVTMRAAPSGTPELNTMRLTDTATGWAVTALAIEPNLTSRSQTVLDVTVASGLTANRPLLLTANNSTSGYVSISADL